MLQNCVTSCSVGCLVCCHGCNPEHVINAFTFLPPQPSYKVCEGQTPDGPGKLTYLADNLKAVGFYQEAAHYSEVHFVTTSCKQRVALVWVRGPPQAIQYRPDGTKVQKIILLHCHGNATDIGMMMGPYYDLTKQLGVEVVGVEYTGYGCSTGSPSTRNTYADIDAAYQYLTTDLEIPAKLIVVYGQSVGSGPAVSLASKRTVGGLILHSPMMSGIKVIDPDPKSCCRPSCVFFCFDFFRNDQRIKRATSPVLIIHGQADEIVKCEHGQALFNNVPKQYRWPGYFPKMPGHNDIVERDALQYYAQVSSFLRGVARPEGVEATIREPVLMGKPTQVHMSGRGNDAPDQSLPFNEPIVGPEDRRYQQLRHEKATSGTAKGGSNDLHPVLGGR